jgi:hypothetical protein
MPITTMTPIRIRHALECFYFGIDMFNHNPSPGKLLIICFFPLGQLMIFAGLHRNETVWMVFRYPKVSQISVKRYRFADAFSSGVFIHLEIMLTAFGLLNIQYLRGVSLNDDLGLQRMALFFPE